MARGRRRPVGASGEGQHARRTRTNPVASGAPQHNNEDGSQTGERRRHLTSCDEWDFEQAGLYMIMIMDIMI